MTSGRAHDLRLGGPQARKIEHFLGKQGDAIKDTELIQVSGRRMQSLEGSGLLGFGLESPPPEWTGRTYTLPLQGWIVAENGAVEIEVLHGRTVLRRVRARFPRSDVHKKFGDLAHANRPGFATRIG
ncbi:MAG: hypothetical protein ACRELU_11585, partial [Gemmatimonadota bacterium]